MSKKEMNEGKKEDEKEKRALKMERKEGRKKQGKQEEGRGRES